MKQVMNHQVKKADPYRFLFILSVFVFSLSMTARAQSALYHDEFDLDEVTLQDGLFKKAMILNDSILLEYDVDRLLQPFQKQAGIKQTGKPFINWSGEIGNGLDGHVGGHYITALAMSYVASSDEATKAKLKKRYDYMKAQLKQCQDVVTDTSDVMYGYLGGVPSSQLVWRNLYKQDMSYLQRSWVPWYNIHKTYAGLRDAWLYMKDEQAKDMFFKLCDWGIKITSNLSDDQMQRMLGTEHGGMNEVYADAYQMSGDKKYLKAAKRFSHQSLLTNMLASSPTYLDGKHANTQIPKVIGFSRIAQLDNASTDYAVAAKNFWNDVVNNRSLALGGNSVSEHFLAADQSERYTTSREGPESCNTYNMLKLTEDLFATDPDGQYVDFYERAMYNHILSTQNPETGGYVYFTSARPQHYRVYSQVNEAMWCCVGTGMENHGKYGQFVYTHKGNDSLYVNLFIASRLNWKERGIVLTQGTRFPYEQQTTLTLQVPKGKKGDFTLLVRKPGWVIADKFVVTVNGAVQTIKSLDESYVALTRRWKTGDVVTIELPMKLSYETMPHYNTYVALTYGPILLGAKTGTDNLTGLFAGEGRMEHVANGPMKSLTSAPILIGDRSQLSDSIVMTDKDSLKFKFTGFIRNKAFKSLVLQPFYSIHEARYMMYWWQMPASDYEAIEKQKELEEARKIELDNLTVDFVKTGEQQSESDHFMVSNRSQNGIYNGEMYRDAPNGASFGYIMSTKGLTENVQLMVRYYGNETGRRRFSILIDGDTLATENNANRWRKADFVNVQYPIPSSMLKGKSEIKLLFQADPENTAGGVYYIRLLKAPFN